MLLYGWAFRDDLLLTLSLFNTSTSHGMFKKIFMELMIDGIITEFFCCCILGLQMLLKHMPRLIKRLYYRKSLWEIIYKICKLYNGFKTIIQIVIEKTLLGKDRIRVMGII